MHALHRAKVAWFTDEGHDLRGVVHIGANTGQEIPWYLHAGHRPILAFEPHPDAFADLQRDYGDVHGVICVNAALGEEDGELTLLMPEDGDTQRGSKFHPVPWHGEGHEWTRTPSTGHLNVPLRRFDSWVAETGIDLTPFDVLVVDVQGMELEVLRGMGRTLDGFRFLNVECSERAMYDGEASAREVIDWLAAQGFEQQTPTETHDDILFMRMREPAMEGAPQPHWPGSDGEPPPDSMRRKPGPEPSGVPPLREWALANGWPELKDGRRKAPEAARRAYAEAFPA